MTNVLCKASIFDASAAGDAAQAYDDHAHAVVDDNGDDGGASDISSNRRNARRGVTNARITICDRPRSL